MLRRWQPEPMPKIGAQNAIAKSRMESDRRQCPEQGPGKLPTRSRHLFFSCRNALCFCRFAGDGEDHIRQQATVARRPLDFPQKPCPDLVKCLLRSQVVLSHHKDHALDEAESMLEHQRLQLSIVDSAPEL